MRPIFKSSSFSVFAVFLFLAVTAHAYAMTYYVDSSGGADSNNGTSSSTPWQTIAKVNSSTFNPGDNILFKRGDTWQESLIISQSGSAGNPITVGAYATGTNPIISGGNVMSGFSAYSGSSTPALVAGQYADLDGATSSRAVAFPGSNTAGNLIAVTVWVSKATAPTITVTDSRNTYNSAIAVKGDGGGGWVQTFYATNIGAGANTVIASAPGAAFMNVVIAEFSGVSTSSPEDGAGASATGTGTAPASGNFTVTKGDLVVGTVENGNSSITPGSGYTGLGYDGYSLLEYQVASTTTANATFVSANGTWAAQGVAFKVNPGPANIWQKTGVTTQPIICIINGSVGTLKASIGALSNPGDWFWSANTLYVYGVSDPSGTVVAGQRQFPIMLSATNYNTVAGLTIEDSNYIGLYAPSGSNLIIQSDTITQNAQIGLFFQDNKNVLVDSNTVTYNGSAPLATTGGYRGTGVWGDAIHFGLTTTTPNTSANNTVSNNSIHDNWGYGLSYTATTPSTMRHTNQSIYGNTSYNNATGIYLVGLDNSTIHNNACYSNTQLTNENYGIAVESVGSSTFYDNSIYNNYGSGIQIYGDASTNGPANGNSFYDNVISGSTIYGDSGGFDFSGASGNNINNNLIYSNIIYGNTQNLKVSWSGIGNVFYGNTLYGATDNNVAFMEGGNPGSFDFQNNIFSSSTNANFNANTIAAGVTTGHNIYYAPGGGVLATYNGTSYTSANITSFEGAAITTNPKFNNVAGSNFTLASSSPAIDAGANLGTTYDMALDPASTWPSNVITDNQNSYGSGWDIGAYVFVATSTPSVAMIAPSNSATVSGTTTVSASSTAVSPASIVSVQFYLDGSTLGSPVTTTSSFQTYSYNWDTTQVSNGTHSLYAFSTNNYGNVASSSAISVTVSNVAPTPTPGPSVSVASAYGVPYGAGSGPGINAPPTLGSSTAISMDSLEAEIQSLLAELASLEAKAGELSSPSSSAHFISTRNLSYGMTGNDVEALQYFLINQASGPAALKLKVHGSTEAFGTLTYNALVEFQKSVGIPATGYFGPITRAYVNSHE